jgi:hypothetical protein
MMTEYEIADLAASNTSHLIGLGSMIQTQIASMADGIQQFMTILFGYLAASYFVGASLDKRQVWILSTLYVLWQLWVIIAVVARGIFLALVQNRFMELGGNGSVLGSVPDVLRSSAALLLCAALLASLYFMWSVRHPAAEEA